MKGSFGQTKGRHARTTLAILVLGFVGCSSTDDDAGQSIVASGGRVPADPTAHGREKYGGLQIDAIDSSVEMSTATPIGQTGFTANARIQPHGRPTKFYVEYGKTTAYGSKTASRSLGPRLAAHYYESWDTGLGGWLGGIAGDELRFRTAGGKSGGGYVAWQPTPDADPNHEDGIGFVQLSQYLHAGTCTGEGIANPFLGGGDPDLRDARVAVDVRGEDWVPNGAELLFWTQSDIDISAQNDETWRRANWAYTDFTLTEALLTGTWQHVEYRLHNDSRKWSYSGTSVQQGRPNYQYWTLDDALGHVNCDFFHMLAYVDLLAMTRGNIDYDELHITYRNHSLLFPSNGGKLVNAPSGSGDATKLTDGWRNGAGKSWQTAANPTGPQVIEYSFAAPVKISAIQIHQDLEFPSREVSISASNDGASWRPIGDVELAASAPEGPNYAHVLLRNLSESAKFLRVQIRSGYQSSRWGLGEIEVFGSGAELGTDNDWYDVNLDVRDLEPGTTYHYRIVAVNDALHESADETFTTPDTRKPIVSTGAVSRVTNGRAHFDGRLTAMGSETWCWFDFGPDTKYGDRTRDYYVGLEQTPRTVTGDPPSLVPGRTYHYRLVAHNAFGFSYGEDRTFVAK